MPCFQKSFVRYSVLRLVFDTAALHTGSWGAFFRFFRMHWDHEPDREAESIASRNVTVQRYEAPDLGLLVGEIGSGQRLVY
jgi:hypothetical protein